MPPTALIVDDEAPARRELSFLLKAHPHINVVAEAATLAEARAALQEHAPDLVFLDIHLMGENGFDLAPDIPSATRVIFVTADDTAALRAFRVNALHYLLKPISPAMLADAIDRLSPLRLNEPPDDERVLLRSSGARRFVHPSEIIVLEAVGAYTRVYLTDGTRPLVLRSLKSWHETLPPPAFLRIHRNAIVNLARVQSVSQNRVVELAPGALRFEASRREISALRARLAGER